MTLDPRSYFLHILLLVGFNLLWDSVTVRYSMAIIFWMWRCQWIFIRSLNKFSTIDSYDVKKTSFASTTHGESLWEGFRSGRVLIDIMHICLLDRLWSEMTRVARDSSMVCTSIVDVECCWWGLSISFSPLSMKRLAADWFFHFLASLTFGDQNVPHIHSPVLK